MEILSKRQQIIVMAIKNTKTYITSISLAKLCKVSTKTISTEIKTINMIIKEYGATIQSVASKGLYLDINNLDVFTNFLQSTNKIGPSNQIERVYYITGMLLQMEDYIRISDIADSLFIDRTMVSRCLKQVRNCLDKYSLTLVSKPSYGLKIKGNEFHHRLCMAEYLYHRQSIGIIKTGFDQEFEEAISHCLFMDGLSLPQIVFNNMMVHLEVMLYRIGYGHFIDATTIDIASLMKEYEYLVAKDIATIIEDRLKITLTTVEVAYLTIHLLGKRSNSISAIESCVNNALIPTLDIQVEKMFNDIYQYFGISFKEDYYLKKSLGIHIKAMRVRITYQTYLRNPMLEDIKENYLYAYHISMIAWISLEINNAVINASDEIAYMALLFQYALERKKRGRTKKKILLVNDYCTSSTELLVFSLLKRYHDSIEITKIVCSQDINTIDFNATDFILTTVHIEKNIPVKQLIISPIIKEQEVESLCRYFEKRPRYHIHEYISPATIITGLFFEERQELIQYVYHTYLMHEPSIERLDTLLNRQHICPCEMDMMYASLVTFIEHGVSKIYLIVLKKPMVFDTKIVKSIFVIVLVKHHFLEITQLYEGLDKLLQDDKSIENINNSQDSNTIYDILYQF